MESLSENNGTMHMNAEEEIPSTSVVVNIFFAIIAILGISGNGLVLVVIAKVPDLRSITNILIGHQSFVDFISSLLLLLTFFPPAIDLTYLSQSNHAFSVLVCKLWVCGFIYWAVIKVSTVNLVLLTLERYLAVVYPHHYRQRASRRKTLLFCLIAWIIGPLSEIYFLFTYVLTEEGQCSKRSVTPGGEYAIAFMVFIFTLVVPMAIMSFVYVSIIRALRPVKPVYQSQSNIQLTSATVTQPNGATISTTVSGNVTIREAPSVASSAAGDSPSRGNGHSQQQQQQQNKGQAMKTVRERARRNVLATMFLVSLTYAICWSPNQIIYFYYNLTSQSDFKGSFYRFTVVLAGTNVCVNPIIYAFKYRKFQQGLRQVFLRKAPVVWETTATDPS